MKFIAVHKDQTGNITHLLTDQERVVTLEEARKLAQEGEVASLTDLHADGTWFIDDGIQQVVGNNLGDLPEFQVDI
jgi:hypothetical protein